MGKKGEEARLVIFLDTSVFIDLFRNFKPAVGFFDKVNQEEVLFSALTEAELVAGSYCANLEYKERTLRFLGGFKKIVVENKIALLAGDLKRTYGVGLPDAVIAASAIVTGSVLFTANVKDFQKISELKVQKPY